MLCVIRTHVPKVYTFRSAPALSQFYRDFDVNEKMAATGCHTYALIKALKWGIYTELWNLLKYMCVTEVTGSVRHLNEFIPVVDSKCSYVLFFIFIK